MKRIPLHLRYVFAVYCAGIAMFTILRIVLTAVNSGELSGVPLTVTLQAFWMGFRFDSVISGYILILPCLVLSILEITGWLQRRTARAVSLYMLALYGTALFICCADMPFYNYYHTRLNYSVLNWTDYPSFMVNMVLQDATYYPYIAAFLILTALLIFIHLRIFRHFFPAGVNREASVGWKRKSVLGLYSLLACLVLVFAIRGRLEEKSPIRWGTAFFSPYQFPNQLGLNPVFTFMQSWFDARDKANEYLRLMDESEAVNRVRKELAVPADQRFDSPIARPVSFEAPPTGQNVVLVIMESMAAWKMGHFGNPDRLTPVLDSLADRSTTFSEFYTAGIHTFNGVYSTLFGFPALMGRHPMAYARSMQPFTGAAYELGRNGYQTLFVCTHDEQFDNIAGFVTANGFQHLISLKDYPPEQVKSTLGVPDHIMFEFAIPRMTQLSASGKPFFAVFLTASDHGPYIIPDNIPFTPHAETPSLRIVEYADWAIGDFLAKASREPWFKNTIFLFVADHGSVHNTRYLIPLEYNHSPFIIHAPGVTANPRRIASPAGQIDVFPTIMGLVRVPYVNNTLGIDALRQQRRYMVFSADDKLGCVDGSLLWAERRGEAEALYAYRTNDNRNLLESRRNAADSMRLYTYAILQTTEWLLAKHLVRPQESRTSR